MLTTKINSLFPIAIIVALCVASCGKQKEETFIPSENAFTADAHYIDPETALLSEGFTVCNEDYILQYYNPEHARYSKGKNELRNYILSNYTNKNYTDSGYLNIRFVINCNGEAGRYVIHENDLNLEPTTFTKDLKEQLFKLTTELKDWNPNFISGAFHDTYMYISYRIEHGNITEILP
ncbi:hypothetical protein [uncultured Kordia sp.]|uniref:hypothetical protein n=1 Tax=uncultured Kordia sp. TaxID=507699 RepID=UPI0026037DB4|nr:hypothetical protein [uncultured Kordia sp.]